MNSVRRLTRLVEVRYGGSRGCQTSVPVRRVRGVGLRLSPAGSPARSRTDATGAAVVLDRAPTPAGIQYGNRSGGVAAYERHTRIPPSRHRSDTTVPWRHTRAAPVHQDVWAARLSVHLRISHGDGRRQ